MSLYIVCLGNTRIRKRLRELLLRLIAMRPRREHLPNVVSAGLTRLSIAILLTYSLQITNPFSTSNCKTVLLRSLSKAQSPLDAQVIEFSILLIWVYSLSFWLCGYSNTNTFLWMYFWDSRVRQHKIWQWHRFWKTAVGSRQIVKVTWDLGKEIHHSHIKIVMAGLVLRHSRDTETGEFREANELWIRLFSCEY